MFCKAIAVTDSAKLKAFWGGPWLVWLSGLSAELQSKWLPVQFPARAHTWVAGQVPVGGGTFERQPHNSVRFSSSPFLSLPLSLKISKILKQISFWKGFTMLDAVKNIHVSQKEVKISTSAGV